MLPTMEQLRHMQRMNIMELDRKQLADAKDIVIDTQASAESRLRSFLEQTGNPFAQNVGEYILQTGFMEDTEELLDDRMILLMKKKGQIRI